MLRIHLRTCFEINEPKRTVSYSSFQEAARTRISCSQEKMRVGTGRKMRVGTGQNGATGQDGAKLRSPSDGFMPRRGCRIQPGVLTGKHPPTATRPEGAQ